MLARRRLLGEYNLGKTIGQGAFSKVKIATHRETNEKVAIKVVDKKMMEEKARKSKQAHEEREKKKAADEARRKAKHAAREGKEVPVETHADDTDKDTVSNEPHRQNSKKSPKKEPPPSLSPTAPPQTQSFVSKLQKEVQLMMRLDHPNIVRIYQVLETEDECFIVMEYAKGGELIEYIAARDHLNEKEARKFFRQIISALDHCHMANVVHRDLKLENILLNGERNVLLSDFGLGRTFDPDSGEFMKTFCGTPNYAAVELISGIPYVGVKSDIWAMGVVLYVMMTGRPPFAGDTIAALYKQIKSVEYKIPPYFSPDLIDLLSKILVKDPVARADMEVLRSHPWVNYEYVDRPIRITPKITGNVDINTLSGVITSIYYDKTFVVFVFHKHSKDGSRDAEGHYHEVNSFGQHNKGVTELPQQVITLGRARRMSVAADQRDLTIRRKSIAFAANPPPSIPTLQIAEPDENGEVPEESSNSVAVKPHGLAPEQRKPRRFSLMGMNASPRASVADRDATIAESETTTPTGSSIVKNGVAQPPPVAVAPKKSRRMSLQDNKQPKIGLFTRPQPEPEASHEPPPQASSPEAQPNRRRSLFGNNSLFSSMSGSHTPSPAPSPIPSPAPEKIVKRRTSNAQTGSTSPENSVHPLYIVPVDRDSQVFRRMSMVSPPSPINPTGPQKPVPGIAAGSVNDILQDSQNGVPHSGSFRVSAIPAQSGSLLGSSLLNASGDGNSLNSSGASNSSGLKHSHSRHGNESNSVPTPTPLSREASEIKKEEAEEDLTMLEIEAWHITHKPPKEIRAMRFAFNSATTSSTLDPSTMFQDVHKTLLTISRIYNYSLNFSRVPDFYMFHCELKSDSPENCLEFELEVCKVFLLKMHGLRMKRISGNAFIYKDIYAQFVSELHWSHD